MRLFLVMNVLGVTAIKPDASLEPKGSPELEVNIYRVDFPHFNLTYKGEGKSQSVFKGRQGWV